MRNGCILNGGVGSGKSRTSLAYFYFLNHGDPSKDDAPMSSPLNLYIITTARKRDTGEWEEELRTFGMSINPFLSEYNNSIVVDSWNNIGKYTDAENSFFIFDEQRVVGKGAWVKSFLKIAEHNKWILLSATPGDTWQDYIPVFIANGFYKNRTEFNREHVVFSRFSKYPKVDRYLNTGKLLRLRNQILVDMDFHRGTVQHHIDISTDYDVQRYKATQRNRWNYEKGEPIETAGELCYILRKLTNSHPSRVEMVKDILTVRRKVIVFYNFDYERDALLACSFGDDVVVTEWSGHKHQDIPKTEKWVYLVQYTAGAEGWNCIETDTIIFFSQNYSYKTVTQASGRIDRLNTPFKDLYYYHLKSKASIDISIDRALKAKKDFNEKKFAGGYNEKEKRRCSQRITTLD